MSLPFSGHGKGPGEAWGSHTLTGYYIYTSINGPSMTTKNVTIHA